MDKKAIFINTASQVTVRFITLIFALISIKLLTNYLGPSGVGNYNTITTYINFFIVVADLGLFAVGVREISRNPLKEKKIISNIFFIRLISALLASLLVILIVYFTSYSKDIKFGAIIGTVFLFFNLLSSVYDIILQYRLKMQFSALAEFLSKLITLAALYFIIKNHGSFLMIVSTIALSGIALFILKWLFSIKFIRFSPQYDQKIASWIINMAWPLGLVFIVNNLFFKLDTIMLFVLKGAEAVGIYTVAYKVLEVTTFIAGYFASSLKPTFSQEITGSDSKSLSKTIEKSIFVMILIAIPITISCVIFPKEIILFLSNSEFLSGSNALVILALSLPFIYLDILLGEILIAKDSRKLLIRISIFMVSFNFLANLVVIPYFSFVGAAATTLISEVILFFINLHYTQKIISYKVNFSKIIRISILFILSILFAYIIKFSHLNFILLICLIFIFFSTLLHFMGIVPIKSIKELLLRKS